MRPVCRVGAAFLFGNEPLGADLSRHIIVPDNTALLRIQTVLLAQLRRQFHQAGIGPAAERPGPVGVTGLDGHRVAVRCIGAPAHLLVRDAADHLALQSHNVVAGHRTVGGLEIVPVIDRRCSGVAHPVYRNRRGLSPLGVRAVVR